MTEKQRNQLIEKLPKSWLLRKKLEGVTLANQWKLHAQASGKDQFLVDTFRRIEDQAIADLVNELENLNEKKETTGP